MSGLTEGDRADLARDGRPVDAIEAALARLADPTPSTRLVRAATVGDGIRTLDDPAQRASLAAVADAAAAQGRVSTFVPASGAATRLCAALWAAWDAGATGIDGAPPEVARVLTHAPRMALWPSLVAHGAVAGDARSILDAMFGPAGLGLHRLPKALIPFHRHDDDVRTAFDEHLVEASLLAADASGRVRVHLTVAPEHIAGFQRARDRAVGRRDLDDVDVALSVQDPATDLPALTSAGRVFRDAHGAVFFRPGGHGALLSNLEDTAGDLVLVKNVDNVVRAGLRGPVIPWRKALLGLLVETQRAAWAWLDRLDAGEGAAQAAAWCRDTLGVEVAAGPAAVRDRLDRPWRVAGMVRNTGQPGGGPFWAEAPDGVSLQIVEAVQIDRADPAQDAIVAGASHFNPVDLALGLRDRHGRPYALGRFTDPAAVLVSTKQHDGATLRVLEHPGLWNGQMARWNTVFVEIPEALFQPVKTLADLLGDGHVEPGR